MNGHRELNGMHPAAPPFSPEYSQFSANNMGSNQTPWPNSVPAQFIPQHPQQQQLQQLPFNPGFMNRMQQFSSAMGINPLFQQQIFQDALAMSQPVEAADEPLLVQVLLSAKKKRESYKDALNGLHGVSPVFCTHYTLSIEQILRIMATPPVCGKITIWITRTTSIHGSICASRRRSLSYPKGILDTQGQNHSTCDNKSNASSLLLVSQYPRPLPSKSENMPRHPLLHLCTPPLLEEVP